MTPKIDYFFSMGSPFAYIGLEAFAALTKAHGAHVEPHAIALIEENGGIYSRNRPAPRRAYWIADLKRWAALRGAPLEFANREALSDPAPAGRLVIAARLEDQDWLALALALHRAFWGRAEDIGRPDIRRAVAEDAGFDGAALEALAQSQAVAARCRDGRDAAKAAGVFGVPTYRHGGELFWGQDSLPFLERRLRGERLVA